ncbi:type II secretion system protein [Acinetobacter cumulans]|uniref:Type II secretion system protein n=1 Tax=Acinetobacter cumulans TaxID=2136182 RepID=A0A3A8GAK0_9GAMM|nr:type II secretion system protein [Acinetobacter cumulans]RKG52370.1 type II secretion system protein [Acinetobacter cumulans]
MMKQQKSKFYNQHGFTLLESLIGLLVFSIVILGSGAAISKMLVSQKDLNSNFIIINVMQTKLQNALSSSSGSNICDSINKDSFVLASKTYYTACASEKITLNDSEIEWPVLAVSTSQTEAQTCADGTVSDNCYIVGR